MLRLLIIVLFFLFIGVVAGSAYMLLPACGLGLPWANFCKDGAIVDAEEKLAALDAENAVLARDIAFMERELALYQCTAVYEEPEPPPPVAVTPPAPVVPDVPELDTEGWRRGDLASLEGCWDLDSDYKTQNVQTGEVTDYTDWQMCFAQDGTGEARMRATNGVTCSGAISGSFETGGRLSVAELANLTCSNDTYIYRRNLTCSLSGGTGATCRVNQPEVNRTSTVQLRRTTGDL